MKKKVVLAYSGGLDTSCCVKWIKDTYGFEVICFSAFLGEVADKGMLRKRALSAGASKAVIKDLKSEFAKDFLMPALFAHATYEEKYFLATALGRPLIAKHLVAVAQTEGASYVAHGCTGKGNDQVRIEVGVRTLDPSLKIIAPLKEWCFSSREEEIAYAHKNNIKISVTQKSPYSIDRNIWGAAIEAGILENPWVAPPEDAYTMTKGKAGKAPRSLDITFKSGVPVALNGKRMLLVTLIETLNSIGGPYKIGRVDMIEDRLVGIKSREIYEAPAAYLLMAAHKEIESMVFDRDIVQYKAQLSLKYSELVYNGLWFSRLRESLDAFFRMHQEYVTGTVRFVLSTGSAQIVGRMSPHSIYNEKLATYSEDDAFDHTAAKGFIELWGLPHVVSAKKRKRKK